MKDMLDHGFRRLLSSAPARPRGRDLESARPRRSGCEHIQHRHRLAVQQWRFGHTDGIEGKVIVMGGGNTAMDCCRTSLRLGAESVTGVVRSAFEVMKASEWEKEDAMREGIPIINNRPPKEFVHENGKLKGRAVRVCGAGGRGWTPEICAFRRAGCVHRSRPRSNGHRPGQPLSLDRTGHGLEFDKWDCPVLDEVTLAVQQPESLFRRRQCIWSGEHHLGIRPCSPGSHQHSPVLPGQRPQS